MKITIDDPWLGEREVGDKADLIRDQLRLLNKFKNDGRKPTRHLLEDIAVYEFILNSDDPNKFAESYLTEMNRLRDELRSFGVTKMTVAKNLKWDVKVGK